MSSASAGVECKIEPMPHTYAIHGLTIRSEFPLPELESSRDFQPQILIRHGRVSREGIEFDGGPRSYQAQPGLIRIAWDRVGAFELRNGQELIVDPESEVEPEVVRLFVLGAAMGLLLHQRGLPVLHASVVAHGPCCVGIVGAKGWGKSTLASALLVRGWSLVTDDLAVIDLKGPDPMVAPGVRVVKLWPQSLAALGGAPEDHPRIHSQVDTSDSTQPIGFPNIRCDSPTSVSSALRRRPRLSRSSR